MSPSHSLRCMIKHAAPCHVPCATLFPTRLPHPSPPPTSVTSVRNNMIYHTNIPFSTILIALIPLLTFPTIPPACIFHACPGMVSTHPPMIVIKTLKKRHLISHGVSGALCATIMFILCSSSSQAAQCSPVYLCTSPWSFEDITFREKEMRGILLLLRGHRQGGH